MILRNIKEKCINVYKGHWYRSCTANTLVFMRGKGIIIREPSVVAVDTRTDKAKYVGKKAKDVIGRTPGSIVAVRLLRTELSPILT